MNASPKMIQKRHEIKKIWKNLKVKKLKNY